MLDVRDMRLRRRSGMCREGVVAVSRYGGRKDNRRLRSLACWPRRRRCVSMLVVRRARCAESGNSAVGADVALIDVDAGSVGQFRELVVHHLVGEHVEVQTANNALGANRARAERTNSFSS